eukprot:10184614-Alexandrium_andersonii.AAC.1
METPQPPQPDRQTQEVLLFGNWRSPSRGQRPLPQRDACWGRSPPSGMDFASRIHFGQRGRRQLCLLMYHRLQSLYKLTSRAAYGA